MGAQERIDVSHVESGDGDVDYNFLAGGSKAGLSLAEARAKVWAALHDGKFSKKVSGGSPQFFARVDF